MTYVVCPYCGRMWETTKTWYEKCPKCRRNVFIPWNKVKPTTTSSSTTTKPATTKPPTTIPVTTKPVTTNTTTTKPATTSMTTTFPPIGYAVHEDQVSRIRSSRKRK